MVCGRRLALLLAVALALAGEAVRKDIVGEAFKASMEITAAGNGLEGLSGKEDLTETSQKLTQETQDESSLEKLMPELPTTTSQKLSRDTHGKSSHESSEKD